MKKDFHTANNELVLIGRKALIDTINNPMLIKNVAKAILSSSQTFLLSLCQEHNIKVELQPKNWFDQRFKDIQHQHACIYLKTQYETNLEKFLEQMAAKENSLVLFLDELQDPYNFGAILRTAAAAQVDGIIIKNKRQVPLNPTVLKVSAGAGLLLPVISVNNLVQTLEQFQKIGYWSYATILDVNAQIYNEVKYAKKSILIMGNEGDGISFLLAKKSDFKIYIPIATAVDSLNVSVAAGIMIYQIKA